MKEQDKQHNQDLQALIERYALNDHAYQPLSIDVMNGNVRNMKEAGPRQAKTYGELTKHGLVHVWADPDKSQYSNAEVLVIDHSFAATYAHNYNRVTGAYDWSECSGLTYSVPLVSSSDLAQLVPLNNLLNDKSQEDRERIMKSYQRHPKLIQYILKPFPQTHPNTSEYHLTIIPASS